MKYCRNCGTLLEDTIEHCIRCGIDVTKSENVSMYPIEVMETLEEESKRKKTTGKIVAMIIGLVVVLVVLVLFFLYGVGSMGVGKKNNEEPAAAPAAETATETVAETTSEDAAVNEQAAESSATENEAEVTPEATPTPAPESAARKVKDGEGAYYDYITEMDDGGNVVFTTLIPEDLTKREFIMDYEVYSDRYPIAFDFTATTAENDVRFTYLSPKKLWYKLSDTGKGRSNERDLTHYMTYFQYDGPRSYLEALLEQSYSGSKIVLVDEEDVSAKAVAKLGVLAEKHNKDLFGDIGDYAYIGEGTTYANMNYEFSAKIYTYEITLPDKDMLFCRYYVPSMAHSLTYADGDSDDMGNVTEWYNFAIACFETGNEDEYDDYSAAFDVFVENSLPTELFMYINECYSKDIKKAVKDNDVPDPVDKELLMKYGKEYKPDYKLDAFDAKVLGILRTAGEQQFKGADATVYTSDKAKLAFFDKKDNKVYISPDGDEYPGESFEELKISDEDPEPEAAPETPENEENAEDKDSSTDKNSSTDKKSTDKESSTDKDSSTDKKSSTDKESSTDKKTDNKTKQTDRSEDEVI